MKANFDQQRTKLTTRREAATTALEEARAQLGPLQLDVELGTGDAKALATVKRRVADLVAEIEALGLAVTELDIREQAAIAKAAVAKVRADRKRLAVIGPEIAALTTKVVKLLDELAPLCERVLALDDEGIALVRSLPDPDVPAPVNGHARDALTQLVAGKLPQTLALPYVHPKRLDETVTRLRAVGE